MKKTVLVTGGAGFVGSHLCERLVKEGHNVISLDNYFTGSPDNHVDGVEYRTGHTKDIAALIPEKIDSIYHLGEYSRVAPSLEEPEVVWDLNIIGTLAVLEYWRACGCKLIYIGSSTKFAIQRDDQVSGKDRAPYSWAKAMNTELVHNYGRWYDLSYSIAYFYNVYGPRERSGQFDGAYGTIVETFRQCYLSGTHCTINGTGEQTRAFTHVQDTIDALIFIEEKGEKEEYAICAKEVYSLLELAEMFGLEVEFAPSTKSSRSSDADDTTHLQQLGWQQKQTLKQYIESCKK
ncbi:MAG: UDP-glucose 4-epimerase [Acidimicrobiales bacterium]|jgi:UDP-glucose 4-epimerase